MEIDDAPSANPRVRITGIEVLSDNWYTLRKATFEFRHSDGTWSTQIAAGMAGFPYTVSL